MANEAITKLAVDVERVLVAGAHLAAGDAGLTRDKEAIEKMVAQLGANAPPVLSRLAEQVGKATTSPPKEQPAELLGLAVTIAQIRAAQAQPAAVEGEAPLAASPEVVTPCNAKDLYALHDALVHKGQGRAEVIREAIEREDTADLRLVHAAVQAMGDSYGELADLVSREIVPKFGAAIVEPVLSKLKFPGRTVDGRRITALIAVEKGEAKPLVDRALKEGSPEMREAALDSIATYLPGVPEFEAVALAVLEKERSGGVRRAAVRALKGYSSDASLAALFGAVDGSATLGSAAEALGGSKHPRVVDRLLERVRAAITKATAKAKSPEDKAQAEKEAKVAVELLGALGEFEDPRIAALGREMVGKLRQAGIAAAAADAMLRSATKDDLRFVADLLGGDADEYYPAAVKAALRLEDEAVERLLRLLRGRELVPARIAALRKAEFALASDAWVEGLIGVARDLAKRGGAAKSTQEGLLCAIDLLARARDPRATPLLVDVLETHRNAQNVVVQVVWAFHAIGDSRALPALLARLRDRKLMSWHVSRTIERLATRDTVDKVREIVADSNDYTGRYLLRRLEEKFPGA
jgi:hypothetical protein